MNVGGEEGAEGVGVGLGAVEGAEEDVPWPARVAHLELTLWTWAAAWRVDESLTMSQPWKGSKKGGEREVLVLRLGGTGE